jgi:hypothetical protein
LDIFTRKIPLVLPGLDFTPFQEKPKAKKFLFLADQLYEYTFKSSTPDCLLSVNLSRPGSTTIHAGSSILSQHARHCEGFLVSRDIKHI